MYDLSEHYSNTFDVMQYTISAMKEVGFSKDDIEAYIAEATQSNNANLIDVSVEYVSKCNAMSGYYNDDITYDGIYSDCRESYLDDTYNDLTDDDFEYSSKWGRDHIDDDSCYDDNGDCYEGFNTCRRRYYWDNDDLEF